jgi:hypothetical protein
MVHLDLEISPRNFEKIWSDSDVIFRGLWEDDSKRKPEAKTFVTLFNLSVKSKALSIFLFILFYFS